MSINDFRARLAHTPIPEWMARCLSWALAVNAVVAGWDYLHTPGASPQSLEMVKQLAPLRTWGYMFLVAGAILVAGMLVKRHALVWLGHLLCSVLYVGFTAATAQAVWKFSHSPEAELTGSIYRAVTMSLVVTVAHIIMCWTRGPIPRRGDEQ